MTSRLLRVFAVTICIFINTPHAYAIDLDVTQQKLFDQKLFDQQSKIMGELDERADQSLEKGMTSYQAFKAFGLPRKHLLEGGPVVDMNSHPAALTKCMQQGVATVDYFCSISGTGCFQLIFVDDRLDDWGYFQTTALPDTYPELKKGSGCHGK